MYATSLCAAMLWAAAAGAQDPHQHGAASGIPAALQEEHQHLQAELSEATRAGTRTGAAAAELQRLLQPHFEAEEQYALPQLGALMPLATGKPVANAEHVVQLSTKLKSSLSKMLEEHKGIAAATDKLAAAATAEGKTAQATFAANLKHHAMMEEQIMYPAAILVGEYLKKK